MNMRCVYEYFAITNNENGSSQAYYTEDDMSNTSGEDVGDAKGAAQDDAQHSRPTHTSQQISSRLDTSIKRGSVKVSSFLLLQH